MTRFSPKNFPAYAAVTATLLLALFSALPGSASAQDKDFARFGLALKTGAAAGPIGLQAAWNYNRHFQICGGVGGARDFIIYHTPGRTDAYFLMAKAYWNHVFVESGYSLNITSVVDLNSPDSLHDVRAAQGLPWHLGYEFGNRRGFFFATSVGYQFEISGANRLVGAGSSLAAQKAYTPDSGPSLGLTLGYYLDWPQ